MDWRIILPYSMIFFWWIVGCTMALRFLHKWYMGRWWQWRLMQWAERIMVRAELGAADDEDLLRNRMTADGHLIGWLEMVSVYRKYIVGLPLQTRHELIDKLINNQQTRQRRTGEPTNLVTLIEGMNAVERETLVYACGGYNTLDKVGNLVSSTPVPASDLANEVIGFKLSHPY